MLLNEKNRGIKQQTDHRGEDKKEMQHNYVWIYEMYIISVWNTNVSGMEYILGKRG